MLARFELENRVSHPIGRLGYRRKIVRMKIIIVTKTTRSFAAREQPNLAIWVIYEFTITYGVRKFLIPPQKYLIDRTKIQKTP